MALLREHPAKERKATHEGVLTSLVKCQTGGGAFEPDGEVSLLLLSRLYNVFIQFNSSGA